MSRLTPAVLGLIIANVALFILQQTRLGEMMLAWLALWPWGPALPFKTDYGIMLIGFHIWQLVTYAFLHGGITHILFNMFALWMFGCVIEQTFGMRKFLFYYFVCVITAALCHLAVVSLWTGGFYPTIGASGGIFGVLLAFGMLFPHQRIYFWFALPMPAWVFVTGYGVLELVLGVTGSAAGVAHFAHLGGMAGGIVLILYWTGKLPLKPKHIFIRR
ncbi:MAG: rhomboid family intramembrane serine protease [Gammaproteobacteria bacterium]|nr:rhomboid family intramembrane serine protease [Gammaproteobacteria bacterium]